MDVAARAQDLLEQLAGPSARLRPDQLAAISAVVEERRRALVVQRTGFGKSAIYFIATQLLREAGAGPTLVVSPLLALMRDQVAAAARMGVRSATVNSTNLDDWGSIETRLAADEIDLLCISPERLNNHRFVSRVLPDLSRRLGLLVVDEAHCISDWGHDFRPDYRRIRDAIAGLAPGSPVLATTATANARVCADVAEQLGRLARAADGGASTRNEESGPRWSGSDGVLVLRGSLDRETLHLGVVRLPSAAHRLAWVAQRVPQLSGTGIVYVLTVAQTVQVADFLRSRGIDAAAYSGDTLPEERTTLEAAFRENRLKALVATSALGMGVDKPDVAFVVHLGAPPSPVAYYQQVGRAGRAVDRAEAWLLPGDEDRRIWQWFASVGMPDEPLVRRVLGGLRPDQPTSLAALERDVDLRRTRLETVLKILDVDGAVERVEGGWVRTGQPWAFDTERVSLVRKAREEEAEAMLAYGTGGPGACLLEQLRRSLDDPGAEPCGRCTACAGAPDPVGALDDDALAAAMRHLRAVPVLVEPRKMWAAGLDEPKGRIKPADQAAFGRTLCRRGDAGWWPAVEAALAAGEVDDDVMQGVVATLKRWDWVARPRWVCPLPSQRHATAVRQLAERIGAVGRLPVFDAVERVIDRPPQEAFENSAHRLANVWGALAVRESALPERPTLDGPVLLVDDTIDSGWTMTVAATLLLRAGAGAVLPLALVRA